MDEKLLSALADSAHVVDLHFAALERSRLSRDYVIGKALDAGMSVSAIARAVGMTRQGVMAARERIAATRDQERLAELNRETQDLFLSAPGGDL